jgi:signal transduction histidine kinase/CheY-like chemotaxis protein/putative methionine-R-sulfoxide reductase with GAF domain
MVEPHTFESLLHHLREPLLLATRSGVIVVSNAPAAEALGTSVAALQEQSLAGFSSEPERLETQLASLRRGGSGLTFPVRSRDGRRFFCEASVLDEELLLVRLSGGPEPDQRLRAFEEALARIDGVSTPLSDAERMGELYRTVLSQGMATLGATDGGLFLVDATGANVELKGSLGYPDDVVDRYRMLPLAADLPLTGAVKRKSPVLLGTLADYQTHFPEFTRNHPEIPAHASMACIPLLSHGRALGVIALCFPMPWEFSDTDRLFLEGMAQRCADALERGRPTGEEPSPRVRATRSVSQVTRLQAFTGALAQAIDWPQVVEAVVDMAMAATGAHAGGLWILSSDGTTVSLVRNVGANTPAAAQFTHVPLVPAGRMPILDTIRTGAPSWIESCRQMEESYPAVAAMFAKAGEASLTCLPLFAQGRCIGGLALIFEGVHRFDESERSFLLVLSWYAAQALERARLYAAEREARQQSEANARRSEFLAHAGTILASSLDFASTLSSVAAAAVPRVADWCIVELEEQRRKGVPSVVAHADPLKAELVRDLGRRYRALGDSPHGIPAVIRSGKPALYPFISATEIRDGIQDRALAELYRETGMTSAMVVPISSRGQTLGAIVLVSARADRRYDEADLAMAEELGRRAGSAVDNARLFEDARQADRLKDEFLAMLGHELRNPLTPIVTALDLMNLRGGEAFRQERNLISQQVRHVVRLVDDLLDVSRVMRGKIQLQRELIEVAGPISTAVETASPLLEQRAQVLSLAVPAAGLPVHADRGRLSQAIANLLTNAAKYTEPRGAISLSAGLEDGRVCIRVSDTGIGIAPETLPTVFELFVQAAGSVARSQGGLGIGLTVVRNLIELHGGSVSAHSAGIGLGSEFVIRLPLADRAALGSSPAVEEPVLLSTPHGRRRRVLLVDDNADIAQALAETVEALGCITRVAYDGPSAIAAAESFQPDLALLDIGLPVMDGYELARRLRRTVATSGVRLVAVTGYGQPSDRERSSEAGFDEHIVKPVGLDTLRDILARLD